jgi:hypothetical protein
MENNNWEVKWVTNELSKSLEYWEKQKNESMSLYKVEVGDKTISIDERMTIVPITLNGKRIKITVSED